MSLFTPACRTIKLLFATMLSFAALANNQGLYQTQTIILKEGWNAVFLEVQPDAIALEQRFNNAPIQEITTFYDTRTSAQFINSPNEPTWNIARWRNWFTSENEQSVLTDLFVLNANRAYLVKSSADYEWKITGQVVLAQTSWNSDGYHLTGFTVAPTSAPTFAEYFGGSPAHQLYDIHKMVNGEWQKVTQPSSETIQSGAAYWVYTKGASTFSGPLNVTLTSFSNTMDFKSRGRRFDADVRNINGSQVSFSISHEVSSGSEKVPLVNRRVSNGDVSNLTDLTQIENLTLQSEEYRRLRFTVDRTQMDIAEQRASYLLITGAGMRIFIPVLASRP